MYVIAKVYNGDIKSLFKKCVAPKKAMVKKMWNQSCGQEMAVIVSL